jgi:hypothetical protein
MSTIYRRFNLFFSSTLLILLACNFASAQQPVVSKKNLSVLLVTGGCCHDYEFQSKAMQLAAQQKGIPIDWTIVNQGGKGTKAMIDLYKNPKWFEGFDVVIHNECFADTDDEAYIRSITKPHFEGVNAVVIHCAMHTYRSAKIDDWREFLGVTSRKHDHQARYPVTVIKEDHPIMKSVPPWTNFTSSKRSGPIRRFSQLQKAMWTRTTMPFSGQTNMAKDAFSERPTGTPTIHFPTRSSWTPSSTGSCGQPENS